ncbi:hypothetical protein WCE14_11555 [Acinetobacter schindleri]
MKKSQKIIYSTSAISTQKLRSSKNRLLPLNEKIKDTVNLKSVYFLSYKAILILKNKKDLPGFFRKNKDLEPLF